MALITLPADPKAAHDLSVEKGLDHPNKSLADALARCDDEALIVLILAAKIACSNPLNPEHPKILGSDLREALAIIDGDKSPELGGSMAVLFQMFDGPIDTDVLRQAASVCP